MGVLELESVEVDHCFSCHGVWLDSGELEGLIERIGGSDEVFNSLEIEENISEKKKKCPVCHKKMFKISIKVKNKFILDKCINDHGIWFDKGELVNILIETKYNKKRTALNNLQTFFNEESNREV